MDIPIEILTGNPETLVKDLTDFLRSKHILFLLKNQSEIHDFIDFYLDTVSKKPLNFPEKLTDAVQYVSYIFAIVFGLDPKNLPIINLNSSNGPLFAASLLLKTNRTTAIERINQLLVLFERYLYKAEEGFDVENFYSTPFCYYILSLPYLIGDEIKSNSFEPLLNRFFSILSKIKTIPNAINYSHLLFISEVLNNIYRAKVSTTDEFQSAFSPLFEACKNVPSSCLFLYFHIWLKFIRQSSEEIRRKYFPGQVQQIIELLDEVSKHKYTDLNKMFPWFIVFNLNDYASTENNYWQQLRIINLFSSAQRHLSKMETFPSMGDAIQRFSDHFVQLYKTKGSASHILTMITGLQQSLSSILHLYEKIEAVAIVGPDKIPPDEKIYFIDQVNSDQFITEYDSILYSIVHFRLFHSKEEADNFFTQQVARVEEIKGRLHSIAFFFFQLLPKILYIYGNDTKQESYEAHHTIFLHYFIDFILEWIELIIVASYKYMCLTLYKKSSNGFNEVESYHHSRPEPAIQNANTDFYTIFNRIMILINDLPPESHKVIATGIVIMLSKYHRKNMISIPCLIILDKLPHDQKSEANEHRPIFAHVLATMINRSYERISDLNTRSFNSSDLLYRWCLLILRIGKPREQSQKNSYFGSLTLFYFKVIVTSIFANSRWMCNQSTALKTVQAFIDAEKEIHPGLPQRLGRNTRMNMRMISFDDFGDSAKLPAASAFLDYFQSECDLNALPIFIPGFETALKIGDSELVTKAAQLTHKYLISDLPNKWSECENEEKRTYFKMYFDSINAVTKEQSRKILKDIPLLTPLFLREPKSTFNHFMNANIEDLNFNLTIIMQQVSLHAQEDEDHYRNLFALLTNAFDYIKRNLLAETEHLMPIMRYSVNLLCQCFSYDAILNTVRSYTTHLNEVFVPPFSRGNFDLYFICLLGVIGESRSDHAQIATDLAVSFLESSKDYGMSDSSVKKVLTRILAIFSSHDKLFSCLTGMALLNRYFPGTIILDYIRTFLVQLTDIPASEAHFFSVMKQFLKSYLAIQTEETQTEFVQMVYDIICPLSTPVRIILQKRLEKLGIKLHIHSYEELQTQDIILYVQRITLAFTCGVEFDFQVNAEIMTRLRDIFTHKPDQISILEHFARVLQLTLSIAPHKESLLTFINDDIIVSQFLNLLCNSLTSHYKPVLTLAKKAISKFRRLYSGELFFAQQIYEYCSSPEKIFTPFGPQPERISFYRRLSRYLPDKVSITIVELFTNAIVEYEKKSNLQKIKYMTNFVQFVKAFTVRELMTIDIVSDRMNEYHNGTTCLHTVIDVFIRLNQNTEIPFLALTRKHMIKFLCIFADNAVKYICFSSKIVSTLSLNFFSVLVSDDKSFTLLKALHRAFISVEDMSTIHPSLFLFIRELSNQERFSTLPEIQEIITTSFDYWFNRVTKMQSAEGDDRYNIYTNVTSSMINVISVTNEMEQMILVANAFTEPILMESSCYHDFIDICFKRQEDNFKLELFNFVISNKDSLSPTVFGIFLVHFIINTQLNKATAYSIWEKLISYSQDENLFLITIRSMYHLAKQHIPAQTQLTYIYLNVLKQGISSPDPDTLVYSIKFSKVLQEKHVMSPKIFRSYALQLLTYSKFYEVPYAPFLVDFIREGLNIIAEDPNDFIITLSYLFHNTSISVREFIRIGTFFIKVPELLQYLPFSLPGFMTNLLEQKIQTMRVTKNPPEDPMEANELFMFLYKFFSKNYKLVSKEEFQHYANVSFNFLTPIFSQPQLKKDPSDNFYMLLKKSNIQINSPFKVFNYIPPNSQLSVHSFGFVCIAMEYIDDSELFQLKDIIEKSIRYIENDKNYVNPHLFSIFTDRICQNVPPNLPKYCTPTQNNGQIQSNWMQYKSTILVVLNQMINTFNDLKAERVLILFNSILKNGIELENEMQKLFALVDSVCAKNPYTKTSFLLIQYLLRFIERVHYEKQSNYLNLLISKIKNNRACLRAYTELIAQIFLSEHISPVTKEKLSVDFPLLIKELDHKIIKSVIQILTPYNTDLAFTLRLNLVLAKQANPTLRIQVLDNIRKMLPQDPTKSIVVMFDVFSTEYWTNEFVPLLVGLVTKKVHFWQPLFALSNYFISIGSELVWPTFAQLITEENIGRFVSFYTLLVSNDSLSNLSSIINGISRAFLRRRLPLPSETVQVAALSTGEFDTLSAFMTPDTIHTEYLLPHRVNDTVFGLVRPTLDIRESAAMALTLLNQYEAASSVYLESEQSDLIEKMRKINSLFLLQTQPVFEKGNYKYTDYFKLDISTFNSDRMFIEYFQQSQSLFKEGKFDEAKAIIKTIIDEVNNLVHDKVYLSIFNKERISLIMNITKFISQLINKETPIQFDQTYGQFREFHCMNPIFIESLNNITNLLLGKPPREKPVETGGDMLFFADSSMICKFKTIVGRNSRGLIAIGPDQILEYFKEIADKETTNSLTVGDMMQFAPFCFNYYCILPCFETFKASFTAYKNIFSSNVQMKTYYKHESAVRLITMIRFIIYNEEQEQKGLLIPDSEIEKTNTYISFICSFEDLFSPESAVLWCFWLHQLVEMSRAKWFFDHVCHLFMDMSYRSVLYANKLDMPYFVDVLQKRVMMEHVSTQIEMMQHLTKFFDTIINLDFKYFTRMKNIYRFSQESSKLTPDQASKIDLFEMRKNTTSLTAVTQFEKTLSLVTQRDIERIDFQELYQLSQNKDNTELMDYIQQITSSPTTYTEYTETISDSVAELNKNLPFIFSFRFDETPHISIIRMHEDISLLSQDVYLIHATTSINPRIAFLVQKSSNENGFHSSVITLSNIVLFFRNMIHNCYPSRARNIQMHASHLFEIGPSLILVYLPSDLVSLEELFTKSTMKTPEEWLEENTVDGELTEEGRISASNFNNRTFQQFMLTEMAQTATSNIRINLLHTFSACNLMRELFSATYPPLGRIILCYQAALMPMLHLDFDNGIHVSSSERTFSSSRFSPNIVHSMGPAWQGEYIISIAACAQALVSKIETARSLFEVYIGDSFPDDHSIQNIKEKSEDIENYLLTFASPSGPSCSAEDCEEWIEGVEELLRQTMIADNQPISAIPWF